MIVLAYLTPELAPGWGDGVLRGLKIAAAAAVAQPLEAMARSLAVGPIRGGMAIGAGLGLLLEHGPVAQILALAAGAAFGFAWLREPASRAARRCRGARRSPQPSRLARSPCSSCSSACCRSWPPGWISPSPGPGERPLSRRLSLVFGGGHVVLPVLQQEIVRRGWLDQTTFLAGYGAAQALLGPLFSFAGSVGSEPELWRWAAGAAG